MMLILLYCLHLHDKTDSSCWLVTLSHTIHYLQTPDDGHIIQSPRLRISLGHIYVQKTSLGFINYTNA
jgi:hypothetical protein